eukprot:CAMPEP_0204555806 /NCGR_PEP_ID=MMETSP0661-20131031/29109_1 /ASSEMBLY_ACC=CAM_ASM_000606 /TAXON_ID=109239 /ORGANISM="Alexandrium margalefi, Strain AMGDE01CS-322" /LENGTH=422 /DNA_ID=CAMNT_0051562905 /DNA_START=15 /DNA_END=1280 /DNA_ORIENTATION=+
MGPWRSETDPQGHRAAERRTWTCENETAKAPPRAARPLLETAAPRVRRRSGGTTQQQGPSLLLLVEDPEVRRLQAHRLVLRELDLEASGVGVSCRDDAPLAVHGLAALGLQPEDLDHEAVPGRQVLPLQVLELQLLLPLWESHLRPAVGREEGQDDALESVQLLARRGLEARDLYDVSGGQALRLGAAGLVHAHVHAGEGVHARVPLLGRQSVELGPQDVLLHALVAALSVVPQTGHRGALLVRQPGERDLSDVGRLQRGVPEVLLPHQLPHVELHLDAVRRGLVVQDDDALLAVELPRLDGVQVVDLDEVAVAEGRGRDALRLAVSRPEAELIRHLADVLLHEPEVLGPHSHALLHAHPDLGAADVRQQPRHDALRAVQLLPGLGGQAEDLDAVAGEEGHRRLGLRGPDCHAPPSGEARGA